MYAIRSYYVEEIGELENTIVIVTSDNGMAFPRAKANGYEYGIHVPFAVRFPKEFPGGRIVTDPTVITSYSIHYTKLYDPVIG